MNLAWLEGWGKKRPSVTDSSEGTRKRDERVMYVGRAALRSGARREAHHRRHLGPVGLFAVGEHSDEIEIESGPRTLPSTH